MLRQNLIINIKLLHLVGLLSSYFLLNVSFLNHIYLNIMGTAVAQWLRCCVTNRRVAGSIPAGVSGFSIDIKSFQSHYGSGVESASNTNEYQEYFLGVKAAGT